MVAAALPALARIAAPLIRSGLPKILAQTAGKGGAKAAASGSSKGILSKAGDMLTSLIGSGGGGGGGGGIVGSLFPDDGGGDGDKKPAGKPTADRLLESLVKVTTKDSKRDDREQEERKQERKKLAESSAPEAGQTKAAGPAGQFVQGMGGGGAAAIAMQYSPAAMASRAATGVIAGGTQYAAGVVGGTGAHVTADMAQSGSNMVNAAVTLDFKELAREVASLPRKIQDWSRALLQSQEHLAQFSGAIARANLERHRGQLRRDIQSAQSTGESTLKMSRAYNELQDTLQPYRDQFTIFASETLTLLLTLVNNTAKVAGHAVDAVGLATGIRNSIEELVEEAKKGAPLVGALDKMAREHRQNAAKEWGDRLDRAKDRRGK